MHPIEEFLRDLDKRWAPEGDGKIVLQVIGSAALFLQTDYDCGTTDSDILETEEIRGPLGSRLLALAGRNSELHVRHRIFLEVVGRGLPFFPHGPVWHVRDLGLAHFDIRLLDTTDVVVSKLIRFHGNDRADIRAMIEGNHVQHDAMLDRLRSAIERFRHDARCHVLPEIVKRFNQVERDEFGVYETRLVLPEDISR